jgi:hypothetical protein
MHVDFHSGMAGAVVDDVDLMPRRCFGEGAGVCHLQA